MSFDVVALAQAGAQVIVMAMATETWTQVRGRLGQLLGRGDDRQRQQALDELDASRSALNEAPTEQDAHDAQVELRAVLKSRLRADPDLAATFAAFVDELAAQVGVVTQANVTQRASADRGGTVIQAGRDAHTYRPPSAGSPPRR